MNRHTSTQQMQGYVERTGLVNGFHELAELGHRERLTQLHVYAKEFGDTTAAHYLTRIAVALTANNSKTGLPERIPPGVPQAFLFGGLCGAYVLNQAGISLLFDSEPPGAMLSRADFATYQDYLNATLTVSKAVLATGNSVFVDVEDLELSVRKVQVSFMRPPINLDPISAVYFKPGVGWMLDQCVANDLLALQPMEDVDWDTEASQLDRD